MLHQAEAVGRQGHAQGLIDKPVVDDQAGVQSGGQQVRYCVDVTGRVVGGFEVGGESLELPVKLKVHDSIFVPLAKWAMLLTGNYRCIQEGDARSIKEAVHTDLDESRSVYDWVNKLCEKMGADPADLVPFEKYANAAQGLLKPSSAARALYAGAPNIERVDCLVKTISAQHGMQSDSVDRTVSLVDARLAKNREAAA